MWVVVVNVQYKVPESRKGVSVLHFYFGRILRVVSLSLQQPDIEPTIWQDGSGPASRPVSLPEPEGLVFQRLVSRPDADSLRELLEQHDADIDYVQ
jgi:hypothetical protein